MYVVCRALSYGFHRKPKAHCTSQVDFNWDSMETIGNESEREVKLKSIKYWKQTKPNRTKRKKKKHNRLTRHSFVFFFLFLIFFIYFLLNGIDAANGKEKLATINEINTGNQYIYGPNMLCNFSHSISVSVFLSLSFCGLQFIDIQIRIRQILCALFSILRRHSNRNYSASPQILLQCGLTECTRSIHIHTINL